METIYYQIDTERIAAHGGAEGQLALSGQETEHRACVPRTRTGTDASGGKVLNFADFLPEQEIPKALEAWEPQEDPAPEKRMRRPWLLLDVCASAAVVAAALGALIRFFTL